MHQHHRNAAAAMRLRKREQVDLWRWGRSLGWPGRWPLSRPDSSSCVQLLPSAANSARTAVLVVFKRNLLDCRDADAVGVVDRSRTARRADRLVAGQLPARVIHKQHRLKLGYGRCVGSIEGLRQAAEVAGASPWSANGAPMPSLTVVIALNPILTLMFIVGTNDVRVLPAKVMLA